MSKLVTTLNGATRPLFSKRHYTWLAKHLDSLNRQQLTLLALDLYRDNSNFKPVRWFQSVGYDREMAEQMHDAVMRIVNK